eukprot:UN08237
MVKEHGVINYFGEQRFSSTGTSMDIGLAMLQRDWVKAVQMILKNSALGTGYWLECELRKFRKF